MTEKIPSPENIESRIEQLLETLENYAEYFDQLTVEQQDRWYDIEMEAKVGKDRESAKTQLEGFIEWLKEKFNK
ncbi:MAG: hypothetical protein AAB885_00110 [Patescibacteria group bacterium]